MVRRFAVCLLVGAVGLGVAPRPAAAAPERVVTGSHYRCMYHCDERAHLFQDTQRSTAGPVGSTTGRRSLAQTTTQTKSTFCQRATPDPTKDPANLTLSEKILSWLYAVFCTPSSSATTSTTSTSTTSTSTTSTSSTTTTSTSSTTTTTTTAPANPLPSPTTGGWPTSGPSWWSLGPPWSSYHDGWNDDGWDRHDRRERRKSHHDDDDRWEHRKKRHHDDDDRWERRKKRHHDDDDRWERRKRRDRDDWR